MKPCRVESLASRQKHFSCWELERIECFFPFTFPTQKYTKRVDAQAGKLSNILNTFSISHLCSCLRDECNTASSIMNLHIYTNLELYFLFVLHESNLYIKLSYLKKDFIFYRRGEQSFFYIHRKSNKRGKHFGKKPSFTIIPFLDYSFVFPAAMLGNHSFNFSNIFPSGLRKSFIWMDGQYDQLIAQTRKMFERRFIFHLPVRWHCYLANHGNSGLSNVPQDALSYTRDLLKDKREPVSEKDFKQSSNKPPTPMKKDNKKWEKKIDVYLLHHVTKIKRFKPTIIVKMSINKQP